MNHIDATPRSSRQQSQQQQEVVDEVKSKQQQKNSEKEKIKGYTYLRTRLQLFMKAFYICSIILIKLPKEIPSFPGMHNSIGKANSES